MASSAFLLAVRHRRIGIFIARSDLQLPTTTALASNVPWPYVPSVPFHPQFIRTTPVRQVPDTPPSHHERLDG